MNATRRCEPRNSAIAGRQCSRKGRPELLMRRALIASVILVRSGSWANPLGSGVASASGRLRPRARMSEGGPFGLLVDDPAGYGYDAGGDLIDHGIMNPLGSCFYRISGLLSRRQRMSTHASFSLRIRLPMVIGGLVALGASAARGDVRKLYEGTFAPIGVSAQVY